MAMKLDGIVPFGRSLDEYKRFFSLDQDDLEKRILGAGDGPASFNAEMTDAGRSVISVDPLYAFDSHQIDARFREVIDDIIGQVRASPDDWVWSYHGSLDRLRESRVRAFRRFVNDYERGRIEGRYVVGELPRLPFDTGDFDIAVCSHLLFLYSEHLDYEFHRDSLLELLRVASEVRVFPVLTLMRDVSSHLCPLIDELESKGFTARVETVDYEFQRGGTEMLRVRRRA